MPTPDETVTQASYTVYQSGNLIIAEPARRSGLKRIGGTSAITEFQSAINTVHAAGGGTILTREISIPETGLTHYADTMLLESYKGTGRKFYVLPDGNLIKLGLQHGIIERVSIPIFYGKNNVSINLRDGYLQLVLRDSLTGDNYNVESYFPETIGYGTYEWKAKITTPAANRTCMVGFAEEAPSQWKDSIFVYNDGVNYIFSCVAAGTTTSHNLAGQDWTVERTFKVEWALNSAKLYVDTVLTDTIVTNVPSKRLVVFMEASHAAAMASHTYIYGREWVKTA